MTKNIAGAILHTVIRRKVVALSLVMVLLVTLAVPSPVRAQLFLVGLVNLLQTVYDIIKNDLAKVLDQITSLTQGFRDFYQVFLFPQKAIDAARAFVTWMSGYFNQLINQVLKFPVMSSTLTATQPLETLMRNGSLDFNQMSQHYHNVYGKVPEVTEASPFDRNLIDVDDAMALSSVKSLGVYEATIHVSLGAAGEIENRIKDPKSAPGAAPFLSAAGILASIQTQAMIQKMIATQIRQEAAMLAHRNALVKRDVILASEMRGHISNFLKKK